MNILYKNSRFIIPVVWLLCLLMIYIGKVQNMINYGFYKMFISEFVIWFSLGTVTNILLRIFLNKRKDNSFMKVFLILLLYSLLISIVLWLLLYFPITFFTDAKWVEVLKISTIFLTFYTNCFIISVWYFFYSNLIHLQKINDLDKERLELESTLKESQLNALKGQINPHFMFNSLNNIRGLILENPEKSREMITRLSEMLRYSLTKNNVNAISIEEEIEVVDNFIAISKIQFEERLQFKKEIQPETLKMQIPPMVIQLLVENAVKHGIANIKQGGIVKLRISVLNDNLVIEVSNSGKLIIDKNSTQLGLQNIKERIALLYGEKASFNLEEMDNTVKATINLPIN